RGGVPELRLLGAQAPQLGRERGRAPRLLGRARLQRLLGAAGRARARLELPREPLGERDQGRIGATDTRLGRGRTARELARLRLQPPVLGVELELQRLGRLADEPELAPAGVPAD